MDTDTRYLQIGIFFGFAAGIAIWIATMFSWSFLVGLAVGWIPAIIGGLIAMFIWPLIALALVGLVLLLL